MAMKILILDDNGARRQAMQGCLADRLYPYESLFFEAPQPMLAFLRGHLADAICISLDHDMELIDAGNGQLHDPGSGREVATFLAEHAAHCPVVLHTTNTAAADAMQAQLVESGWTVYRVAPWGDLDWVDTVWFRTVRRAILDAARSKGKDSLSAAQSVDGAVTGPTSERHGG